MTTLCTRKPTADFALSIKTPCRRCRHLPTTRQAATASASILAVKIEGLPNACPTGGNPTGNFHTSAWEPLLIKVEVRNNMAESGKVTSISRPRDDGTTEIIELDNPRTTTVK
jgi:hypothetical protein